MAKYKKSHFRSGLEDKIHKELTRDGVVFEYEPADKKIDYTVPESYHKYTPDFVLTSKSGKQIIVESKGIWDYEDRYKHLLIRQQHPDLDIRFVFSRPKQRIRKGSKTTYADICDGLGRPPFKGIQWKYSGQSVPRDWYEE